MGLRPPVPGVQSVPEYMVSGTPWVTGSLAVSGLVRISFPAVTKFFVVKPTVGTVTFGFTEDGVTTGDHAFTVVSTDIPFEINIKIRDLWMSGTAATVDVLAGLTSIPRSNYPHLTGSDPAPSGSQFLPGV